MKDTSTYQLGNQQESNVDGITKF